MFKIHDELESTNVLRVPDICSSTIAATTKSI